MANRPIWTSNIIRLPFECGSSNTAPFTLISNLPAFPFIQIPSFIAVKFRVIGHRPPSLPWLGSRNSVGRSPKGSLPSYLTDSVRCWSDYRSSTAFTPETGQAPNSASSHFNGVRHELFDACGTYNILRPFLHCGAQSLLLP